MAVNTIEQLQSELQQPNGRLISDILSAHYLECDKNFVSFDNVMRIKKVENGAMVEIEPQDVQVGMTIVIGGSRDDLIQKKMVVSSICHENNVFVFEGATMVASNVDFSRELRNLRREQGYQTPTEKAFDMQSQAIAERCVSKKKNLIHMYPENLRVENVFGENIHEIRAGQLVKLDSRIIRMEDVERNKGRGWTMDARGHDTYDGLDGKIYKSVFVQDAVKLEPSGDWIIETPSAIYTTLDFCDKWNEMLQEEDLIMKINLLDNVAKEHDRWFRPNTAELIRMCCQYKSKEELAEWTKDSVILGRVSTNIRNMSMDDFSWDNVEKIVRQSIIDVEKERKQELVQTLVNDCIKSDKEVFYFIGYVTDIDANSGARIAPCGKFKNLTQEEQDFQKVEFDKMRVKRSCVSDAGTFIETDKMILTNIPEVASSYSEAIMAMHQSMEETRSFDNTEITIGSRD